MAVRSTQTQLRLVPPPVERTLEFSVLRALGDPGVAPCPVCGGHLGEVAGGVACDACGTEILRGIEEPDTEWDNVVYLEGIGS